jgi:hypothetical protein
MKRNTYHSFTIAALILGGLPIGAQIVTKAAPAPAAPAAPASAPAPAPAAAPVVEAKAAGPSLVTIYNVERSFDDKLRALGEPNTVDLLGATRGLYLDDYGVLFTAEIGLVSPPAVYPFHPAISEQDKVQLHRSKLERLPKLRDLVKEMARSIAASLPTVPDSQQIVVAVRLDYRNWEDTTGLPGQVMVKADRRSVLAGNLQIQEQ